MGPSSGPISAGMMTKFIAISSSDFGKVRMMASLPTGIIMAAPIPCNIRAATYRLAAIAGTAVLTMVESSCSMNSVVATTQGK